MGFDLDLGTQCFLQTGKKQTALVQRGPLFYLPPLTIGDVPDAKMTQMTTDVPSYRMVLCGEQCVVGVGVRAWRYRDPL
eukprot:14207258-Heterocapsa_arctica.AAC.1